MSENMKATFVETRLLRAASWLGRQCVVPCLCLTRKGDLLHVMGTTGYVMIEGDIGAVFDEWPDGHGVRLRDYSPMKQLTRALKQRNEGMPCSVEIREDKTVVSVKNPIMAFEVSFSANDRKPPTLKEGESPAQPEDSPLMGVDVLADAVGAMGKMGYLTNEWYVVSHGKNRAMEFILSDTSQCDCAGVRMLAMPRRKH